MLVPNEIQEKVEKEQWADEDIGSTTRGLITLVLYYAQYYWKNSLIPPKILFFSI